MTAKLDVGGWRLVAEDLAFPEGPVPLADGSVLVSEMAAGRITRLRTDGGRDTVAEVGGGPNGLAVLPDGSLAVCRNPGSGWAVRPWPYDGPGSVPLFLPQGPSANPAPPAVLRVGPDGDVETLYTEDDDGRALRRPSDLCVDDEGGIYLVDGGSTQGRTRDVTGVLYAPSGGPLREIIWPLELPNGIALAPGGGHLHVTETRTRRVWSFELDGPGRVRSWRSLATVPAGGPIGLGSADGCCVDGAGNVIVATIGLGGVSVVSPAGELLAQIPADDPMTTNVALGGTTLYVTLGSSGRVVAIDDWPHPRAEPLPTFG